MLLKCLGHIFSPFNEWLNAVLGRRVGCLSTEYGKRLLMNAQEVGRTLDASCGEDDRTGFEPHVLAHGAACMVKALAGYTPQAPGQVPAE